jgi:hypothetical protein
LTEAELLIEELAAMGGFLSAAATLSPSHSLASVAGIENHSKFRMGSNFLPAV